MPPQRRPHAAGGTVRGGEHGALPLKEQHKIARQDPMKKLAARDAGARTAIDAHFGAGSMKAVGEAVAKYAAKDATAAREIVRQFVVRYAPDILEGRKGSYRGSVGAARQRRKYGRR